MKQIIEASKGLAVSTDDIAAQLIRANGFSYENDYAIAIYNPENKTLTFAWNCGYEKTRQIIEDALPKKETSHDAHVDYYGSVANNKLLMTYLTPYIKDQNVNLCNLKTKPSNSDPYIPLPSPPHKGMGR